MGGVGTKLKPLLSIEVSSLVRVQDKFTQRLLFCTLFGFCIWWLLQLYLLNLQESLFLLFKGYSASSLKRSSGGLAWGLPGVPVVGMEVEVGEWGVGGLRVHVWLGWEVVVLWWQGLWSLPVAHSYMGLGWDVVVFWWRIWSHPVVCGLFPHLPLGCRGD